MDDQNLSSSSSDGGDYYEGTPLLEIDLVDDHRQEGETHEPLGEGRYSSEVSGFSIAIRELHCIHGSGQWQSKTGELETSHATLLMYRIKSMNYNPSSGRRLHNLIVRLRFKSEMPQAKGADDPFVVCYAPAQHHTVGLLKTKVLRNKRRTGNIGFDVDANPMPVILKSQIEKEGTWEWGQDTWATISGTEHMTAPTTGRRGPNIVKWIINENKAAKRFIDSCDVAVLLRRPNDSPFTVEFGEVKADVDMRYSIGKAVSNAKDGYKQLVGDETAPTKKHTYDLTEHRDCPDGVNSGALHELETGTELEKYAFMHILGEVRGVRV